MSEFEKKILEFKEKIKVVKNLPELTKINSEIFGKNGIINLEFKKLGSISPDERKNFAANINSSKKELTEFFSKKSTEILDKEIIEKLKWQSLEVE